MTIAIGVLAGVAVGLLLILTRRGGHVRSDQRPDATGFTPPLGGPESTGEPRGSSWGSPTLPGSGAQVTSRRHSISEIREIGASTEVLRVSHVVTPGETRHVISTSDQVAAPVELIAPAPPPHLTERRAPVALEIAGLVMEAEIIDRLRAVVEESRRQYDRQADGAVRDTVGRNDVTTTTLGEMVAVPPPPRIDVTTMPSTLTPAVIAEIAAAIAQIPEAAPTPSIPPAADIATQNQAPTDNLGVEEIGQVNEAQVNGAQPQTESPAPQVEAGGGAGQAQINPLAWMVGDRHLAAWFPLTNHPHARGIVTGVLLAIAADGALNYLGTHGRSAAMHNTPPPPAALAAIFAQPPPGRNPPPPPAPPNVPPSPGRPTPPTRGGGPAAPNAPASPQMANAGNRAAAGQTALAVPAAVAVNSPAVDAALKQVGTQVRQAAGVNVVGPEQPSTKDVSKSVGDWVKSVQKGVSARIRDAAKSVGKTADSFRSIPAAIAATPAAAAGAAHSGSADIGQSMGDGGGSDELDLE